MTTSDMSETNRVIRHERMADTAAHYLGLQLTLLRTTRGLSVPTLARKSRVPQRLILKIEAGKVFEDDDVTTEHLCRLADVFDLAFEARLVPYSTFIPPTHAQENTV